MRATRPELPRCRVLVLALGVVCAADASSRAAADVVHLANGRSLEGIVVEEGEGEVRLRLPFGEIDLPRSSVDRIERQVSDFEAYLTRKERLGHEVSDAPAWLALAEWAHSHGIEHCGREAARVAADLAPELPALAPLMQTFGYGFDEEHGEWLPLDDLMRRRGFIFSRGRWVSPAEALRALEERETAWRERQERDRRDRLARAIEMMALAQLLQVEESRLQREQAAAWQPYGLPFYGYPLVSWPGLGPQPRGHPARASVGRSAPMLGHERELVSRPPPGCRIPIPSRHNRGGLERTPVHD